MVELAYWEKCYFYCENTLSIAEKFGFSTEPAALDKLEHDLNDAAYQYYDYKAGMELSSPMGKEEKDLLEEMEKSAVALVECFDKLGYSVVYKGEEVEWVWARLQDALHGQSVSDVKDCLRIVADVARTAATQVPAKGAGRDKDTALYTLIAHLRKIYCDGTGRKDRRTYSAYRKEEPYTGRFFTFVKTVLDGIGVSKSNIALAEAIKQTLRMLEAD